MKKQILLIITMFVIHRMPAMENVSCHTVLSDVLAWGLTEPEQWDQRSQRYMRIAAINVGNNLVGLIGQRKYKRLCRAWTIENMRAVADIQKTAQGPFGYNRHDLKCEVETDSVTTYVKHLTLTLNRKDFAAFTLYPYLVKAEKVIKTDNDKSLVKKTGCKKAAF